MLFRLRAGLLKIVLVKSLFFDGNGLGDLRSDALLQAGENLIGREDFYPTPKNKEGSKAPR